MVHFLNGYLSYSASGLLHLTAAAISFSVGLLVYLRQPASNVHRSFLFVALTGATWLFCYGMVGLVAHESDAYLWLSLAYIAGVPLISPCVYSFTCRWLGQPPRRIVWIGIFGMAITLAIIGGMMTSTLCDFVYDAFGRFKHYRNTLAGTAFFCANVFLFTLTGFLSFVRLLKAWKTASNPREKIHIRNFFIGSAIGYIGIVDFFVAKGADLPHVGFISFTLFVLIVAYTIVRHQFLEINLIFRRMSLISLIYTLLFAITLPIVIPIVNFNMSHPTPNSISLMIAMSIGLGAIFSTGPFIYAYLVRNNFWLKEHLTTGLAHELKSPIGAIHGATDLLQIQMASGKIDKQKVSDYIEMIQRNNNRLESYVKDLLHLAKIQDQNVVIKTSRINLSYLLNDVADRYRPTIHAKKIKLEIRCPDNLDCYADKEKLEQVFSNLLSNAIKFSSKGRVVIDVAPNEQILTCSVSDEGGGIPAKDLNRIFDRFYQGKNVNKGSGIGLTIAKAWVEAHGGKIWAESEGEGKGTRVTFTLPV